MALKQDLNPKRGSDILRILPLGISGWEPLPPFLSASFKDYGPETKDFFTRLPLLQAHPNN